MIMGLWEDMEINMHQPVIGVIGTEINKCLINGLKSMVARTYTLSAH